MGSKYHVLSIMGKYLIILVLYILHTTYYILPVYAADSTPSSSIKNKLQQLQAQIASKAAKLKQEVDRKLKDKTYIGIVKEKSDSSIVITNNQGEKIVNINQDTEFINHLKPRSKITISTVLTKDYIAALGDIDETGVLIARKIILLPTPNSKLKTYLWGQVMEISEKSIILKTKTKKNISVSLPKSTEVKLNENLIIVGFINEKNIFEAEFVHKLPQKGVLNLKPKNASQSATSSASPSAKIKSTVKPASR